MGSRLKLHEMLKTFIGNVYFQPPASKLMDYPCVRYSLSKIDSTHADNKPYINQKKYQITVIDEDPDSELPDKFSELPLCNFDRFYTSDNLNHWVYNLYY